MRYRYITSGIVDTNGPISNYRLIASNNLGNSHSAIRVRIPTDLKLIKYSCDPYSTTEDKRTINQLGYDIIIKLNGKWVVKNDLKGNQQHTFHEILRQQSLYVTLEGYMTLDKYEKYLDNIKRSGRY